MPEAPINVQLEVLRTGIERADRRRIAEDTLCRLNAYLASQTLDGASVVWIENVRAVLDGREPSAPVQALDRAQARRSSG